MLHVTEARLRLTDNPTSHLRAFANFVLDGEFLVKDAKVINRPNGQLYVQMPTYKHTDHCPDCDRPNRIDAPFCNWCGGKLGINRWDYDLAGKPKLQADVCHPTAHRLRQEIEGMVLAEYYRLKEGPENATLYCSGAIIT